MTQMNLEVIDHIKITLFSMHWYGKARKYNVWVNLTKINVFVKMFPVMVQISGVVKEN